MPSPNIMQKPPKYKKRSSKTDGGLPPLECSVCGRRFSRPSHHDRHYRTHLPPEGRLSLPCTRCGKTFGRNDVLLRHLRTAHGVDPGPQPKAAQKSCYRCVQLRRKCDRAHPCRLCAAGGATCQYPDNTPTVKGLDESENVGDVSMAGVGDVSVNGVNGVNGMSDVTAVTAVTHIAHMTHVPASASSSDHAPVTATPPAMLGYTTPESTITQTNHASPPLLCPQDPMFGSGAAGYVPHHQHQHQSQHHPHGVAVMDVSPTAGESQQSTFLHGPADAVNGTTTGCSPSFSDDFYLAADTTPFVASLSAVGQLDFRTAGLDWLDFDVPDIFSTSDGTSGLAELDPSLNTMPPPIPPSSSHGLPQQHQLPAHHQQMSAQEPHLQHQQQPQQHHQHQQQQQQQPPVISRQHSSQIALYPIPPTSSCSSTAPVPPSASHNGPYAPPPTASASAAPPPQCGPSSASASASVLPWPFDDGPQDATPHRYSLPPLREVLQTTLLNSNNPAPPNTTVLANLVVLMSDTRIPPALDEDNNNNSSSSNSHGGNGGHAAGSNSNDDDASTAGAMVGPVGHGGSSNSHGSGGGGGSGSGAGGHGTFIGVAAPADQGMAHAANLLKRLVDTYVAKFQPILPLLHVPTWDLGTCPPVLVSAMACLGSLLSDDERLAGLTWSISDICMPMIAWLGSADSANYRDMAYLSALCVHQIYSLGSGNRQLYQNADRSRGILVGGLRGMGCLTTRLSLEDQAEQQQHQQQQQQQHSQRHRQLMDQQQQQQPQQQQQNGHAQAAAQASLTNQPQHGTATPVAALAASVPCGPAEQHEQWLAWVQREREKRIAWSSFEYDCSLCTLTGRRGAVDLSELPSRLPCAETLWEAPSAAAWAALRTRLHPDAQGVSMSQVLKSALSPEPVSYRGSSGGSSSVDDGEDADYDDDESAFDLPAADADFRDMRDARNYHEGREGRDNREIRDGRDSRDGRDGRMGTTPHVSFWGKRLCAQVIGRLLWDLKQLETLSTPEYFGMASLSTAHAANKARLLRALDRLLVSMDQPGTVADLISYNIASLLGHYSHLYTAHDVLDIILYIVRNTVTHGARRFHAHKGMQLAQRRLVATLSRDPQEARRLVYHAAQIVAAANDYLVSAPCEILRLFMGYTFLIVFAAYCPKSHRFSIASGSNGSSGDDSSGGGTTPPAIQLDVPSHRIASTAAVDNWIAHGGPAAIGSVPNLFAEGGARALSCDAQAMLQRLTCWGLAEKFVKILQSFESTVLADAA